MSLKHVYEKLEHIASTPKTTNKVRILKGYLRNDEFYKVCRFALESRYVFHVKKFPDYNPDIPDKGVNNFTLFDFLEKMNSMEGADNDTKGLLFNFASSDPETYEVVHRMCEGDLKCGVGVKNINKAVPKAIFYVPYMRCKTDLSRIIYPAYAQEKNDGTFANMIVSKKGGIRFLTRNGKTIHQLQALKRALKPIVSKPPYLGMVYTGELLVWGDNDILDRATGNGIISSCIYGTADQVMANKALIRTWDSIPIDEFWDGHSPSHYCNRFELVNSLVRDVGDKTRFDIPMTEIVNNEAEARAFYKKIRRAGGEGEVLKCKDFEWKDHDSPYQVKMISVFEAELRITGWKYGKPRTKYADVCGAILCESECGKLKVAVSGMSDEQRKWNWDAHEGDVCTVKFKELSKGKTKDTWSMTHPRLDMLRPDRRYAQTLDDIQERIQGL